MRCPCNQENKFYQDCCEPFLLGIEKPAYPVQLMRSRYTAFVKSDLNYLAATQSTFFDQNSYTPLDWVSLDIIEAELPKSSSTMASVRFKAYYRSEDQIYCLYEKSYFQKIDTTWIYVSGEILQS